MKLLFDCTELSYYNDETGNRAGVFNVGLNIFRELKKRGIDITFYCDYRRYYFMSGLRDIFPDVRLLKEYSVVNRIIGYLIYITRNFPVRFKYALLILSRFYDAYLYRLNRENLKQLEEFDTYFSPFSPPSKEIEQAKLKRFRMIHDVIPVMENGVSKNPKDWYYKIYNSLNDKDCYITNSECTRRDVLKYFPFIKEENIKTTLLGADFEPKNEKTFDGKYVFSLCTLGKRKNIAFTIKNFFKFINRNKINDLKLVLGGGTWKKFEGELNSVLSDVDKTKIVLTGYIKDENLAAWYTNAMMFVYPSLYEGFGLPVLEAMKCGCPVITSNVSSLPEVIGDAGIKVNPICDEEMIEAFEKMYYDNFYRELCRERGLIRAKNFSWEKCASELLEFIEAKSV